MQIWSPRDLSWHHRDGRDQLPTRGNHQGGSHLDLQRPTIKIHLAELCRRGEDVLKSAIVMFCHRLTWMASQRTSTAQGQKCLPWPTQTTFATVQRYNHIDVSQGLLNSRWSNAPKRMKIRRMLGTSLTVKTKIPNLKPALMDCWTCKVPKGFQSSCRPHIFLMHMSLFRKPSMVWNLTQRSTSPSSILSPLQVSTCRHISDTVEALIHLYRHVSPSAQKDPSQCTNCS